MPKFEVIFHYGDTGFEENLTEETYDTYDEAERRARACNKHIDCDDYENGDYYYVKKGGTANENL